MLSLYRMESWLGLWLRRTGASHCEPPESAALPPNQSFLKAYSSTATVPRSMLRSDRATRFSAADRRRIQLYGYMAHTVREWPFHLPNKTQQRRKYNPLMLLIIKINSLQTHHWRNQWSQNFLTPQIKQNYDWFIKIKERNKNITLLCISKKGTFVKTGTEWQRDNPNNSIKTAEISIIISPVK